MIWSWYKSKFGSRLIKSPMPTWNTKLFCWTAQQLTSLMKNKMLYPKPQLVRYSDTPKISGCKHPTFKQLSENLTKSLDFGHRSCNFTASLIHFIWKTYLVLFFMTWTVCPDFRVLLYFIKRFDKWTMYSLATQHWLIH